MNKPYLLTIKLKKDGFDNSQSMIFQRSEYNKNLIFRMQLLQFLSIYSDSTSNFWLENQF